MNKDLKCVLDESGVSETSMIKNEGGNIRVHKKPMQLRDIENRSSNNRRNNLFHESDEEIKSLLIKEKKEIYKQTWNKLDNGMKINRLKEYINEEEKNKKLNGIQKENLRKLLMDALKGNRLTKNTDVNYSKEDGKIICIKHLKWNEEIEGYQLEKVEIVKNKSSTVSKSKSNIDRFLTKKK